MLANAIINHYSYQFHHFHDNFFIIFFVNVKIIIIVTVVAITIISFL